MEWGLDPSDPGSPATEPWCSAHANDSSIFHAAVSSPALPAPCPFPGGAFGEHRGRLICQSAVAAHATLQGLSSTRAVFNPGGKALAKSHCLEGTLEPQAEWPLHTLNSTKTSEVGDTGFTWLADRCSLRTVLPPKRPIFPSIPRALPTFWWLRGGLGSNLSKENRKKV